MKYLAFLNQPGKRSWKHLEDVLGRTWIRSIGWNRRIDPGYVLSQLNLYRPEVVIALGSVAYGGVKNALQAYNGKVHVLNGMYPSGRGGDRVSPTHHIMESLKRIRTELDMWEGGNWK